MDEERYDIEAKCLHNTREVRLGSGGGGQGRAPPSAGLGGGGGALGRARWAPDPGPTGLEVAEGTAWGSAHSPPRTGRAGPSAQRPPPQRPPLRRAGLLATPRACPGGEGPEAPPPPLPVSDGVCGLASLPGEGTLQIPQGSGPGVPHPVGPRERAELAPEAACVRRAPGAPGRSWPRPPRPWAARTHLARSPVSGSSCRVVWACRPEAVPEVPRKGGPQRAPRRPLVPRRSRT